jgi:hypothetical protein
MRGLVEARVKLKLGGQPLGKEAKNIFDWLVPDLIVELKSNSARRQLDFTFVW